MSNPILIIGAGPSEAQVNYLELPDSLDTFGMNLEYQKFQREGWWPTYYGCFDRRVAQSMTRQFKALIEGETTIQHFYMIHRVCDSPRLTVPKLHGKVGDFSMSIDKMGYGGCTGANCAQIAAIQGHELILLVGMDGYKEEIAHGAVKDGKYLKIESPTGTSENYSEDDYHPVGLKYNLPQEAKFHRPAWKAFAKFAQKNCITVLNCSWGDVADFYPRTTLADALEDIA